MNRIPHRLFVLLLLCQPAVAQDAGGGIEASETTEAPVPPSPELLEARAATQEAADRLRAYRDSLLATNEVVRGLALKVDEARAALEEHVRKSPAYAEVTQRIASVEARLRELGAVTGPGRVEAKRETASLLAPLASERRKIRILEAGEGVEGADVFSAKLAEALGNLQKALARDKGMGALILAHNKAVQRYQALLHPPPPAPVAPADPPAAAPVPPAPPPPSGSP